MIAYNLLIIMCTKSNSFMSCAIAFLCDRSVSPPTYLFLLSRVFFVNQYSVGVFTISLFALRNQRVMHFLTFYFLFLCCAHTGGPPAGPCGPLNAGGPPSHGASLPPLGSQSSASEAAAVRCLSDYRDTRAATPYSHVPN